MSLRAKFAAVFLLLLLAPIIATTVFEIDRTMAVMVDDLGDSASLLIELTFEQMRVVPIAANEDTIAALRRNRAFNAFLESAQAFGKGVVYARIEKLDGTLVVPAVAPASANPGVPGTIPPFSNLRKEVSGWSPLAGISALWGANTYEMLRVVKANGRPFAIIAVGISTGLIAPKVHRALFDILVAATSAVGLALIGAVLFGGLVLRPLAAITSGVERMAGGGDDVSLTVSGSGELGVLASRLNELSQRIAATNAQWEAERERLLSLFRSIDDSVLLLDSGGAILFANVEAEGRLGLPAGGLSIGKPLEAMLGENNSLVRLLNTANTVGAGVNDVPIEMGDGDGRAHFLVSALLLDGNPAARLLAILRDLEPLRRLRMARDEVSRLGKTVKELTPIVGRQEPEEGSE